MLKWQNFLTALLCLGLFSVPAAATEMENHILTIPQQEENAVEIPAERLEQALDLPEGDLLALQILRLPEEGHLFCGGVELKKGEVLLRREIENLYYLGEEQTDDWFALLPVCGERCCAVVNLPAEK